MIDSLPKENSDSPKTTSSATEIFLASVEGKTKDEKQKRLLKSARGENPVSSLEFELKNIIDEIIHADQ